MLDEGEFWNYSTESLHITHTSSHVPQKSKNTESRGGILGLKDPPFQGFYPNENVLTTLAA
jgi:hypothetical protein